jgi:hypothetical protein
MRCTRTERCDPASSGSHVSRGSIPLRSPLHRGAAAPTSGTSTSADTRGVGLEQRAAGLRGVERGAERCARLQALNPCLIRLFTTASSRLAEVIVERGGAGLDTSPRHTDRKAPRPAGSRRAREARGAVGRGSALARAEPRSHTHGTGSAHAIAPRLTWGTVVSWRNIGEPLRPLGDAVALRRRSDLIDDGRSAADREHPANQRGEVLDHAEGCRGRADLSR